ncbi:uncharacterized protein BJX67DRAFT_57411 [Aspergillus lucknowensis]|uniref:Uncharacterized protein n=1 Tax=Aspergillus lucknowensis TaxID=176173 RepID=A0ABR4LV58_9EURO
MHSSMDDPLARSDTTPRLKRPEKFFYPTIGFTARKAWMNVCGCPRHVSHGNSIVEASGLCFQPALGITEVVSSSVPPFPPPKAVNGFFWDCLRLSHKVGVPNQVSSLFTISPPPIPFPFQRDRQVVKFLTKRPERLHPLLYPICLFLPPPGYLLRP